MATNELFRDGDTLNLPVPAGTQSGDPVKVGSLVGVAITNRGEGGNPSTHATVRRKGAFHLAVSGAITAIGDPIYFVAADGTLTGTATGNTLYGYALKSKGAGAGNIPVVLARV